MQPQREKKERNSKVLVIEPDAATRSGMKRLLEMSGYSVTAVTDEQGASLAARQKSYDLILFDTNLPPPKSISAGYKLKSLTELSNTPLIIISVEEKNSFPIFNENADKFTIAYITDFACFDEIENLMIALHK